MTNDNPEARTRAMQQVGMAWMIALARLMQFPLSTFGSTRVGYLSGEIRSDEDLAFVRDLPQAYQRDVVYLNFAGSAENGPSSILFATTGKRGENFFQDCELWAFKPWTAVEILTGSHRFRCEADGRLKMRVNRLDEMRARRVALTHKRWRALAEEIAREEQP